MSDNPKIAAPLVSVLMTAYNRQQYIGAAIESVLASTYSNFELLIVDDCSKDGTVDVAKSYGISDTRIQVFINDKNLGDYNNRNKAASYAAGKYIKYLDSDDIIYPHSLTCMVNGMEQFPEAGYGLSAVNEPNRPYPVCLSPKETYLEHFLGYGHFDRSPGSAIIKRDAFNAVGGFSGERMIGDYQLWFKLSNLYHMVKLPRDLVWDRQHAGQESKSDYAKQYHELRNKVLLAAFSDPKCPLSEAEKQEVIEGIAKKSFKQKLFSMYGIRNRIRRLR